MKDEYLEKAHDSANDRDTVNDINSRLYNTFDMDEDQQYMYKKELQSLINEKLFFIRHLASFYEDASDNITLTISITSLSWHIKDLISTYTMIPNVRRKT